MIVRLFIACLSVLLAGLTPAFAANFAVLGQELGISTHTKAKKELASKATLSDGATDPISGGKVLKAIPMKGSRIEVNLTYDSEDRLAAITVQGDVEQVKALFVSLTKGLNETSGVYTNGKGFVEMEKGKSPSLLATTPAYKQAMDKARAPATAPLPMAVVWAISLIIAIGIWFFVVRLQERVWRTRSGGWTREGLLRVAMNIDLPGHDEIMPLVQNLSRVSALLVPLASTFGWYVLMVATNTDAKTVAIAVPVLLLGSILLPAILELGDAVDRHSNTLLGGLVSIGLVAGAAYGLIRHESLPMVIGYAVAGAIIAAIGGAVARLAGGFMYFLVLMATVAGYPLCWPILRIMVARLNSRMRKHQWIGANGKPILTLSTEGISGLNSGDSKLFVPDPQLRRNGKAEAFAIPRFTFNEFCDQGAVNAAMVGSALALAKLAETDERFNAPEFKWCALAAAGPGLVEVTVVNPATGMPTVGNMAGAPDVAGNNWCDTNVTFPEQSWSNPSDPHGM